MKAAEVLRLLSASHLLLLAVILVKDHRSEKSALSAAGFLLSVVGYLLFPIAVVHGIGPPLLDLLFVPGASVPFAFWLLSSVYFHDEYRPRMTHWVVLVCQVLSSYLAWIVIVEDRFPAWRLDDRLGPVFWAVVPRVLALFLVVHALARVYEGARSDLVESRLKLRYVVLAFAGAYIVMVLLGEALLRPSRIQAAADAANTAAIYFVSIGFSVFWFRVAPDLLAIPPLRPAPELPPTVSPLLDKLNRVIYRDQLFKDEGLTITALARHMAEPEHKVRNLINAHLGFRNFNAFLNTLRIDEAKRALADASKTHLSISEIAYDLGYGSLGPFNRAFKDSTGLTPSEYRRSNGSVRKA